MAKMDVAFYTTLGCHLCDEAQALLHQVSPNTHVKSVEIAESDELIALYGRRIPVLKRLDNFQELAWPFNEAALLSFMQ